MRVLKNKSNCKCRLYLKRISAQYQFNNLRRDGTRTSSDTQPIKTSNHLWVGHPSRCGTCAIARYQLPTTPQLPVQAAVQPQTVRPIQIRTAPSSAAGNRNRLPSPPPPLSTFLISNETSHAGTRLLPPLKMERLGWAEDAISSWYTILPNWREITVSGAARRTASRKTMDGLHQIRAP